MLLSFAAFCIYFFIYIYIYLYMKLHSLFGLPAPVVISCRLDFAASAGITVKELNGIMDQAGS